MNGFLEYLESNGVNDIKNLTVFVENLGKEDEPWQKKKVNGVFCLLSVVQ